MEAAQFRERLDITMAPSMQLPYYRTLRERYNGLILDEKPKLPERPADMALAADSLEAKQMIMGAFRTMKRSMGYGG